MITTHTIIPLIHSTIRQHDKCVFRYEQVNEYFPSDLSPDPVEVLALAMGHHSPVAVRSTEDRLREFCAEHHYRFERDLLTGNVTIYSIPQ
ncbi:MAG: hypothetical protein ABL959_09935 [Pyrinomonadaceae bacterium]